MYVGAIVTGGDVQIIGNNVSLLGADQNRVHSVPHAKRQQR